MNLAVVGTVRNVANSLSRDVDLFRRTLNPIAKTFFHLVESDSEDETTSELSRIKSEYPNFDFTSLGEIRRRIPDRIERLIYCRNAYVEKLREMIPRDDIKIVLVADFDRVNTKLYTEAVQRAIQELNIWSAICANQTGRYYDLLALRHKYWCPNNVFEEYRWLSLFMDLKRAKKLAIFNRMIRIPVDAGLIEVNSAFGGLAIYRSETFLKYCYTRKPQDNPSDIDHVILSNRIREDGGKICIDSNLINGDWNNHSLSSFAAFRYLASMRKWVQGVRI